MDDEREYHKVVVVGTIPGAKTFGINVPLGSDAWRRQFLVQLCTERGDLVFANSKRIARSTCRNEFESQQAGAVQLDEGAFAKLEEQDVGMVVLVRDEHRLNRSSHALRLKRLIQLRHSALVRRFHLHECLFGAERVVVDRIDMEGWHRHARG